MKTAIVISDSHGRRLTLEKLHDRIAENDLCIHLGDGSSDIRPYAAEFPQKVVSLRGNCDFSYGEEERVIELEGVRIFACHGHRYGVKRDLTALAARAKALSCPVALYGHTHIATIEESDGVTLINPGALSDYLKPTYCYLVVSGGKAIPTIVEL